jgi:hypothetical protein
VRRLLLLLLKEAMGPCLQRNLCPAALRLLLMMTQMHWHHPKAALPLFHILNLLALERMLCQFLHVQMQAPLLLVLLHGVKLQTLLCLLLLCHVATPHMLSSHFDFVYLGTPCMLQQHAATPERLHTLTLHAGILQVKVVLWG